MGQQFMVWGYGSTILGMGGYESIVYGLGERSAVHEPPDLSPPAPSPIS